MVVSIPEVSLIGQSDRTHFRQVLPTFAPLADRFRGKDERKMYFLVTERGIYPIPTAWRDSWEEHQKEITSEFDLDAARQLARTGGVGALHRRDAAAVGPYVRGIGQPARAARLLCPGPRRGCADAPAS